MKIMKKNLVAIAVAALFAACNSNPKTTDSTTSVSKTDTTTFRNNSFADKGQVIELNGVNDTIVTGDGAKYVKVDPNHPAQTNNVVSTNETPALKIPRTTEHHHSTTHTSTSHSSGTASGGGSTGNGGYSGSGSSNGGAGTQTASTPVPAKKKGWSKAAKGAVIGAGTGAIAGAIISKKKGLGAVIGGVVGGAGGYIIGRNKDKKDGRY
jgi:hypothetical protein